MRRMRRIMTMMMRMTMTMMSSSFSYHYYDDLRVLHICNAFFCKRFKKSLALQKETLLRPKSYNQSVFCSTLYLINPRTNKRAKRLNSIFSHIRPCVCFPGFRYTLIAPSLV